MSLTKRGTEAMTGNRDFTMSWPDQRRLVKKTKTDQDMTGLEELAFDEDLFDKLKEVRTRLANEAGKIPPYVIFSNQILEFLTRIRPTTEEHAKKINGIGEVKAKRYLAPFLEAIREFKEETSP